MAARNKLTHDQITEMCDMRDRGVSMGVIAMRFDISTATADYHFLRNGADSPKLAGAVKRCTDRPYMRGGKEIRPFTEADDDAIGELQAAGKNLNAIARELGRARGSVRNRVMLIARRAARLEAAGEA